MKSTPINHFLNIDGLREVVRNFRESGDRSKNSISFFYLLQKTLSVYKDPFFFKNNIQKFQRVFILEKKTKVQDRPKRT